ncbi:MAG: hypothetical protein R2704_10985 [Microthrixaceae bacterium]
MDTRDLTHTPMHPHPPARSRPADSGRRWAPVVVGAPVGEPRWDDLTEEDLEDPMSGVHPVVEGEWLIDLTDGGDHGLRSEPAAEAVAWWDVPIWKPPRLFLVLGALVLTVVVWPMSSKGPRLEPPAPPASVTRPVGWRPTTPLMPVRERSAARGRPRSRAS